MAYWNDIYCSRYAQVSFVPAERDFDAELRVSTLGQIGLADVRTTSADIQRTPSHINQSSAHLFSFLLLVKGAAIFSHYGNEVRLGAGDFTLCDNAAPHRIQLEADARFLLLRTSPMILKNHLPCPEQLCGLRLPAQMGLTSTAALMTRSIWRDIEKGLPETFGDRVAGHLLDVLGTAYAIGLGHRMTNSTVVGLRKAQARQYIEAHLKDPHLTPGMIAEGLRISPRYLRMLFAEDEETVSAYILRRRLEECATQIASEAWRHVTIAEIAFSWGFNSAPHFARAFRSKFQLTPSDYRRQQLVRH